MHPVPRARHPNRHPALTNTSRTDCRRADRLQRPCSYEHCFCTHPRRHLRPRRRHAVVHPATPCCCPPTPASIEAAQRLRHDVFTSEPGFALAGDAPGGLDADRFDEYCDHLLVREDNTGELVGCYRMLPPPGAIAAGGLYTATEFEVSAPRPTAALAGRDGPRRGARRPSQRCGGAADVGRHPGLPRPQRLRLRHRLRVGAGSDPDGQDAAGQPDARGARLRACDATPPRPSTRSTPTGR